MNEPKILELENGLKCILINNPHVGSVTTHLRGLCGSNYESEEQIGAAHALEHYLANYQKELINQISYSGGYFIGVTSREDTLFMTKVTEEYLGLSLKYSSGIFGLSEVDDSLLSTQKNIILNEIDRIYLNPERLLLRERNKLLFKNSRMKKFNLGSKEDVGKLTSENILKYYKSLYKPERFVLVIAGNISKRSLSKKIKENLGSISSKGSTPKKIKLVAEEGIKVLSIKHLNNKQFICNIDFITSPINSEDHITDNIAAGLINEALNALIKSKFGLVYQIRCNNFASSLYGKSSINYFSSKDNGFKVLKIIRNVLKDISLKSNDQKILNRVEAIKNQYISRMTFNMEKTSSIADYYSYRYLHDAYIKDPFEETDIIKNLSPEKVFEKLSSISEKDPKITVISDREIVDNEIVSLWLSS